MVSRQGAKDGLKSGEVRTETFSAEADAISFTDLKAKVLDNKTINTSETSIDSGFDTVWGFSITPLDSNSYFKSSDSSGGSINLIAGTAGTQGSVDILVFGK